VQLIAVYISYSVVDIKHQRFLGHDLDLLGDLPLLTENCDRTGATRADIMTDR